MVALNPLMNDFQDLMLWVLGVLDSYDDDGVGFSKTLGGMLTAVYLPIYQGLYRGRAYEYYLKRFDGKEVEDWDDPHDVYPYDI